MTTKVSPRKQASARAWRVAHRKEAAAAQAKYRAAHPDYDPAYRAAHVADFAERDARSAAWFRANLRIIQAAQGCADCDTKVKRLVHHHVDPKTRLCSVSDMHSRPLEKFMDEVAKCAVLCDSCHCARHLDMGTKVRDNRGLFAQKSRVTM